MKRNIISIFSLFILFLLWLFAMVFIFSPLRVKEIDYKGHTMLEYTKGGIPVAVCHSPECNTCVYLFD